MEDFGRAIENPEEAMSEMEEEIQDLMEEIECWWADRTPEGTCARREREAIRE